MGVSTMYLTADDVVAHPKGNDERKLSRCNSTGPTTILQLPVDPGCRSDEQGD